jgi:murein DD-endopeptidase MepM/ murein hydrolase activator NlpD
VRHITARGLAAFALITLSTLACGPVAACPQPQTADAAPGSPHDAQRATELQFDWPAPGLTVIECWIEDKDKIIIAARDGATVRAAQSGLVVFAGELKGYGNLVLIRHEGGFVSATYGDIVALRVKKGDSVGTGQPIAAAHAPEGAMAELRFELRRGVEWIDPHPLMRAKAPPPEDSGYSLSAK